MTDELVLTIDEAAAALRVSRDLVYDLIQRGEMPSLTLGRRRLVPRKAIDDILERALEGFDPDRLVKLLAPSERVAS